MGEQSAAIDGVLPADGNRPASAPRPDLRPPTSRYVKWMRKGGLSILDQGLFAGSNFTINILLARWLVPSEFGAFTLAYSVFLFIGAFYLAAFMEPFLIYGSSKYSGCFRRYFSLVVTWHWRAVAGASLLVCAAAAVLTATGHTAQSLALLGLAASLPFLLQMWLMRTVFYSQLRPANAVIGSAVFFVVQIGGACVLYSVGWLSPASAFVVSGLGSACAGLLMRSMLRSIDPPQATRADVPTEARAFSRQVIRDHLSYSKWASGVSVTAWLCANVHYFILTSTPAGLAAVGSMKILDNLLTPFYQCISALGQFLMPMISTHADNPRGLVARTWMVAGVWSVIAVAGYGVLFFFGGDLLRLLFGPSFTPLTRPLSVFSLVVFPYVISMALMMGCRAKVRTDLVFLYHILFSLAITGAYLFTSRGPFAADELMGIVWSNLTVRLLFLPVIVLLFLRAAYGRRGAATAGPVGSP